MPMTTGHSKALRQRLKALREAKDLTLEEVGKLLPRYGGKEASRQTVWAWEGFTRHPGIDQFAAWARAVGAVLVVDIDETGGELAPALLHPETVEPARQLDLLQGRERDLARRLLELLPRMDERDVDQVMHDLDFIELGIERREKARATR